MGAGLAPNAGTVVPLAFPQFNKQHGRATLPQKMRAAVLGV
jgi:hypothetical protein